MKWFFRNIPSLNNHQTVYEVKMFSDVAVITQSKVDMVLRYNNLHGPIM